MICDMQSRSLLIEVRPSPLASVAGDSSEADSVCGPLQLRPTTTMLPGRARECTVRLSSVRPARLVRANSNF